MVIRGEDSNSGNSPHVLDEPMLRVVNLSVSFELHRGVVRRKSIGIIRAVDDVSLEIPAGRTLGLVGESGAGKSTVGRAILGMVAPDAGRIWVDGFEVGSLAREGRRALQRHVQVVMQDPYSSLNPRLTVESIVGEPLVINDKAITRREVRKRVHEALDLVGLPMRSSQMYPHQFSGGQRQRIAIARALVSSPKLIVLDEPTSALDVSIKAQIVSLLLGLQRTLDLTYLCISHDLPTVSFMSDMLAIMYRGRIVEIGPANEICRDPTHPYTQELFSSMPGSFPSDEFRSEGEPNAMISASTGTGCRYRGRCELNRRIGCPAACQEAEPPLSEVATHHAVACHFAAR